MTIRSAASFTAGLAFVATALIGCSGSPMQVTWTSSGQPYLDHPDQDWWHYQYVYHPRSQVYFEPFTRQYFWFDGGAWHEGDALPEYIDLTGEPSVVVKLQSAIPYEQHLTVAARFNPPHGPWPGSVPMMDDGSGAAMTMANEASAAE